MSLPKLPVCFHQQESPLLCRQCKAVAAAQALTADRALLEAQLAHANAHIDGVERQLSAMRRQLAGLVDDAGGDGSPDACADRGTLVLWAGDRRGSGACSANSSEVEPCWLDRDQLPNACLLLSSH